MSQVLLRSVRRDDNPSRANLNPPIEIKFGNETIWGPSTLPPGLPQGIPNPRRSSPFNDSGKFQIFIHISSDLILPITHQSASVDALPLGAGEIMVPAYVSGITYTLDYLVDGNIATITLALLLGIFNAIIFFISKIVNLVVGYVRSLVFLLIQPFKRFESPKQA